MRRIALALVLVPVAAHAEEQTEPVTPVPVDVTYWPDRAVDASAYVAVDAGNRTGAGLVAGAEGQLGEDGCGVLASGGQIAVRSGPSTFAATHWARACVETLRVIDREQLEPVDVLIFPVRLEHQLAWNAVPELGARRVVRNAPFTSERLDGSLAMASLSPDMFVGWGLLPLVIDVRGEWWHQELDSGEVLRATYSSMAASLIEGREWDGDGRLIIFRAGFASDIDRVELVRAEKVPLGTGPLRLDAAFGSAEVVRFADGELERTGGLTGRLGLYVDQGAVRAGAAISQDYYASIDDAIIGEARVDAEASYRDDRRTIALGAFVARSVLVWTDGSGEVEYDPTYGVTLDATWPLYRNVDGRLGAGWARSFYARSEEMLPSPTTGAELEGELLVRFF